MPGNDGQERTEDATPRRRQEARKKGTVARSIDVSGALAMLVLAVVGPSMVVTFGEAMVRGLRQSLAAPPQDLSVTSLVRFSLPILGPALAAVSTVVLAVMVMGLVSGFGQVGFVLSAEPMKPTMDKLNPMNGFKRLFGRRAVFDALKTMAKLVLFGYLVYGAIRSHWTEIPAWGMLPPIQAVSEAGGLLRTIVVRIAIAWVALAAIDYFFQYKETEKQLRMTKDEVKREYKEQEGSPEMKMAQMRHRQQLKKGRLAETMKTATIVVTNPTHYSVAIRYDRSVNPAPIIIAKGQDYLALRIRELASENKVPIVPNPPLARALYKQCEVGDFVPKDLFVAVAEVLAYVHKTVKRLKL